MLNREGLEGQTGVLQENKEGQGILGRGTAMQTPGAKKGRGTIRKI